ncbi:MAG TPA: hypothetical protein VG826_10150 [Pirellulales bacterium]|nr:hypothetical protein [Pirellulales bacterium]
MDTFRERLCREPFEIRLSNGEVCAVRHPENFAIAKTRIAISYPETDRIIHGALVHINSIEAL